jgi:hypothetical protein
LVAAFLNLFPFDEKTNLSSFSRLLFFLVQMAAAKSDPSLSTDGLKDKSEYITFNSIVFGSKMPIEVKRALYNPGTVEKVSEKELKETPFKKNGQIGVFSAYADPNANHPDSFDVEMPGGYVVASTCNSGIYRVRNSKGEVFFG